MRPDILLRSCGLPNTSDTISPPLGVPVRDVVVIGMSDGLTVPFALAAGLSGAKVGTSVVVLAGLAEIAAGSIAMGLGGYLAARTDQEHYQHELQREIRETHEKPDAERREVTEVFESWGLTSQQMGPCVDAICSDQKRWVDFMMRYELGLEEPDPKRAVSSAAHDRRLIYRGRSFIPLAPYFFLSNVETGLLASIGVTLTALFIFGCIKARFTGIPIWRGGFETTMIGGRQRGPPPSPGSSAESVNSSSNLI